MVGRCSRAAPVLHHLIVADDIQNAQFILKTPLIVHYVRKHSIGIGAEEPL
jgi:hypothetical protein